VGSQGPSSTRLRPKEPERPGRQPVHALPDCPGSMISSSDWGKTWSVVKPRTRATGVTVGSDSVGWAIVPRSATEDVGGSLIATADGGRHWRRVSIDCGRVAGEPLGGAHAASLVSESSGWVLCNGISGFETQERTVVHTTEGGSRWRTFHQGEAGYPLGLFFSRGGSGWEWVDASVGLRTQDGGRTWHQWHYADGDRRVPLSVWFEGAQLGHALVWYRLAVPGGGKSKVALVASKDGGTSWSTTLKWPGVCLQPCQL